MADWKLVPETMGERYCSACKAVASYYIQKNYCPYCGEKMERYETPNGFKIHRFEYPPYYFKEAENELFLNQSSH